MTRILMVCLGNICRSPTAEVAVRAEAARAGKDVVVESCGTAGWHAGEGADRRTVAHAGRRDLDLSQHRARQLRDADFAAFDRIYAMDKKNLSDVLAAAPVEHRHKIALFLDVTTDGKDEVPDPYHCAPAVFDEVLDLCASAARRIVASL